MDSLFEYLFSGEVLSTTIPWLIFSVLMLVLTVMIIIEDYKRMKVKAWVLILFVAIGLVGLIVTTLVAGTFQWWNLLPIPVYFVLWVLNTKFNHNRFIGQADIDIFSGTIALYFPIIFSLASVDYGYTEVNMIHILDSLMGGLYFLLAGYILALVIAIIRMIIQKVKGKDIHDLDKITDHTLKGKLKRMKIPVAISFVPLYFYAFYFACFVGLG